MLQDRFRLKNALLIAIGTALYAFGFVYFNMPNKVASNGLAGLTLVFHALFGINPTYSGYLINFPLIVLGAYIFGKRSMIYTIEGIGLLYLFIWIFQKIPLQIDLQHDYLVVSLIAGITAGLGGGIIFKNGGTIGGSDIVARIIEDKFGLPLNQALLGFDIFVMLLSLTYITIPQMMYALIASFMYSQVVHLIQNGGYSVRGVLIISAHSQEIAHVVMTKLGRGVTALKGEGLYYGQEKNILYVALSPTDIRDLKVYIQEIDPKAFVSIMNVDEVLSPEFVASKSKYRQRESNKRSMV